MSVQGGVATHDMWETNRISEASGAELLPARKRMQMASVLSIVKDLEGVNFNRNNAPYLLFVPGEVRERQRYWRDPP